VLSLKQFKKTNFRKHLPTPHLTPPLLSLSIYSILHLYNFASYFLISSAIITLFNFIIIINIII
jgi:hypothetical protein